MAAPAQSTVEYNQKVLLVATQLRAVGEGGTMTELVDRPDQFLRTGKLPDPGAAATQAQTADDASPATTE